MTKRSRIIAVISVAIALAVVIVLACVLPYTLANAYKITAEFSAVDYEQSVNIYDDDYNLVDTLSSSGTIHGVELKNIGEKNSLLYVHHVPNEFVGLNSYGKILTVGKLERLDDLTKAEYGTLQFVFFNLDPTDDDFESDRENVISRFAYNNSSSAIVDFYLPACFDAATVYNGNQYVGTIGDMTDYDPTEYIDKYLTLSFAPNVTDLEPQHIDVLFSVNANTIDPNRLDAARIITVHYRASRGVNFSSALPRVGKREIIKSTVSGATSTHVTLLAVAAAIFVAFVAIATLKKSSDMIAFGIAVLGTVLLTVAEMLTFIGSASIGNTLAFSATTVLLAAAILLQNSHNRVVKKIRLAAIGAAVTNMVIGFILPFTTAIGVTVIYSKVSTVILTLAAVALHILDRRKSVHGVDAEIIVLTAVCCSAALIKAWLPISPIVASSAVFISFLTVALALWVIGYEFFRTEKRDILLRTNLQKEVDIQTATLKNAIADREKMLSFVSHDMRKSALGISSAITDLKSMDINDDMKNIANKIENKNDTMLKAMSEILTFAKRNYSDEPFESVNVPELFEQLKSQVEEDCTANGITFTTSTKNIMCSTQKNILLSVLFNLVFNAIEHANCTEIKVTAARHGDGIKISVADNGVGVEADKDIFSPFTTNDGSDEQTNSGLGLFIVKSQIENMGGTISYTTHDNGSTFTLTLLRMY